MKKYLKIFLSLIMVFALTGCVKYETNMEVKKDKSVTLEMIYAMDISQMQSISDAFGAEDEDTDEAKNVEVLATEDDEEEDIATNDDQIKKEDYEWLEKKGYKVEEYEETKGDSKYVGIKISKTFKSIDDISKDKDIEVDFVNLFADKDKFDDSQFYSKKGNIYKANFLFDFTENGEESDQYDDYQSMFTLKYTVKLPNKAKKHNASKVSDDGKTLTWNLKYGKKNKVEYEFGFGSSKTIILVIGIVAVVAIVAGVVLSKKKEN